jgi:hypothetical protein
MATNSKDILKELKLRDGTLKAEAATTLVRNIGKPVTADRLAKRVYGKETTGQEVRGPLGMVLKGVEVAIKRHKELGLELRKERNENGRVSYGLFSKDGAPS